MRIIRFILLIVLTIVTSCRENSGKQLATIEGFSNIQKAIKNEFGDNAYFTDINIAHSASIGNIIGITVTKDPSSLKMGQWNQAQGVWKQNAEIFIDVPNGKKAADFMYQLDDKINLTTLGALIEQSKKQLQNEKNLNNPMLSTASIYFPKNGDISKTEYLVNFKPENGETTFRFYYKLNGELRKMDY